jgi:hypothetical protein
MIDDHWQMHTGECGRQIGQITHIDPQLQVPAKVCHCGQQRLDLFERHAILVIRFPVATELIGAQTAHTGHVPLLECHDGQFGAAHGDAPQPRRRAGQRIQHGAIVTAIRAWLYKNTAVEAEAVEQREIRFEWRIVRRVAARLGIGKARGRTKYVAMTVTRTLR